MVKNIKIGTPLTLEIQKPHEKEMDRYKCKIVDFDEEKLYIDYPLHTRTGKTGFFLDGSQFQASFVGEDSSVYWFKTEVVTRKKLNIPVIVLTFPGMEELTRIQRRKYVRVDASIDVAVQTGEALFSTLTQDVSGGGVMLIQRKTQKLAEGHKLNLTLVLPMNSGDYHYIEATGTVIRVIAAEGNQPDRVSVEFVDIQEKDRQLIIRYCFDQQMQKRMKALR
ncbi:pilus assembly protein PilZ [Halobacillus litoralis]|uniref:Pilus assembly protein PilZ n=1 Tax=Halobacillus litoralis TaxID=45668 RepID=A0A410M767_9BACI|nr:pilus assembly protein PilZ [Halobacillus litoralis]